MNVSRSRCASRAGLLFAASLVAAGCGEAEPPRGDGAAAGGGDTPVTCAPGQLVGPDGACMAVGIQGCAAQFIGDDGLCHPRIDQCPAGTIPKLDEGCIAVGIPGCAPEFLDDDGICRPAMAKCPAGTFPVPQEGCISLDGPDGCGTGTWGSIPDGPDNIYVDPAYAGDTSDGSREEPFATIAAALAVVPSGGRVALAAGVYDEALDIDQPVEVIGRCASQVRIQGTRQVPGADPYVVRITRRDDVTLRGLEIAGAGIAVAAWNCRGLTLDRVHIRGALSIGLDLSGYETEATIAHSLIEGTIPDDRHLTFAAHVYDRAHVTFRASALLDNIESGITSQGAGTVVDIVGSAIEGAEPVKETTLSLAADALEGGTVSLSRSALVGNRGMGLRAWGVGSTVVVKESVIADTAARDGSGIGIGAIEGSSVTVASSVVARTAGIGISLTGDGTSLPVTATVMQSLIQDNAHPPDIDSAAGILLGYGSLVADGNAVRRNASSGITLVLADGELQMTGNVIEETLLTGGTSLFGAGVAAVAGRLTMTSNAVIANAGAGVMAPQGPVTVEATENLIEGTQPGAGDARALGIGLVLSGAFDATLTGNLITDNKLAGTYVAGTAGSSSVARFVSTVIQRTVPDAANGEYGAGMFAAIAAVEVSSSVLRENTVAGLMAFEAAQVRVDRSSIFDTRPGKYVNCTGVNEGVADGVLTTRASSVDLTDVEVAGCGRAGLLYDRTGGAITRVRASHNRFGIVRQGSPQPVIDAGSRFTDNVAADDVTNGDFAVPCTPPPIP